jgi:hypothetical protein
MKRIVLLTGLIPLFVRAELGPELSYLANTPVSRLEFALIHWRTEVDDWIKMQEAIKQPWARGAIVSIGLDTENNRIQFWGSLPLASDPKRDCAQFIDAARDRFAGRRYGNPLETMFGNRPWDPPAPNDHLAQSVGKHVHVRCSADSYQTEAQLVPGDPES